MQTWACPPLLHPVFCVQGLVFHLFCFFVWLINLLKARNNIAIVAELLQRCIGSSIQTMCITLREAAQYLEKGLKLFPSRSLYGAIVKVGVSTSLSPLHDSVVYF